MFNKMKNEIIINNLNKMNIYKKNLNKQKYIKNLKKI